MALQPTATENMHKLVYLANEYPGAKMGKLVNLFQMPLIDFNAAVWLACDLGYMTVDEKTGKFKVVDIPTQWAFGDRLRTLIGTLTFVFNRLAKNETDLGESELNDWNRGYPVHDQFIAVKYLLNEGFLDSYEIKSVDFKGAPEATYTFYCLAGNAGKKWGKKQFKNQKTLK